MTRVVAITGAGGFIGAHLKRALVRLADVELRIVDREDWRDSTRLAEKLAGADVVFHLAGVNRASDEEIERENVGLAERLVEGLERAKARPRVIYASSTQESRENAYGRSKRLAGDRLLTWAERNKTEGKATKGNRIEAVALVIPNVFGPDCPPFVHSVVATFCRQLATGEQPQIHVDAEIEFVSVNALVRRLTEFADVSKQVASGRVRIEGEKRLLVSELLRKLEAIRAALVPGGVTPDLSDPFDRELYLTYLSHRDDWTIEPQVHADPRGKLYEILKTERGGQIFFSTTRPGVVRGNHWHSRKTERFCVVQGEGVVRLRHVDGGETIEIRVSGASPRFVLIPPFHVHHLENVGDEDLLTLFWASEIFDPADADTFADGSLLASAAREPTRQAA